MEMEPFENPWIKKIRLLTHVTLWSVTLNVGLALLLFFSFRDKKNERLGKSLVKEVRLKESNTEVLVHYFSASFTDLVGELYDMTLLQDGYRKRDLALACLVNYHYFAIEKALPCLTLPKRRLAFIHKEGGEIFELLAFPGLEDRHFQMVTQYIAEERWPLTGEGLFLELKKTGSNAPQTLQAAFFATPDFQSLYTILTRGEERLLQLEALTILLEGSFDVVSSFIGKPPTIETMRAFLQKYVEIGSKKAAHLWLRIDSEYVLRNMDDKLLTRFVSLLEESTASVQLTLKSLLASVRSDALRKEAALKLYSLAGEKPPAPYDHAVAIKRFIPTYVEAPPVTVQPVVLQEVKPKTKTPSKKIFVEAGDSLWKLARKHHTTIEVLKELNQLDSDRLRPGQALFIP